MEFNNLDVDKFELIPEDKTFDELSYGKNDQEIGDYILCVSEIIRDCNADELITLCNERSMAFSEFNFLSAKNHAKTLISDDSTDIYTARELLRVEKKCRENLVYSTDREKDRLLT